MQWEDDAARAMQRVPFFVRRLARGKVEDLVRSEGRDVVTVNDVNRARDSARTTLASPQSAAVAPQASSRDMATTRPIVVAPPVEDIPLPEETIRLIERLTEEQHGCERRFYGVRACGGAAGCPLTLVDVTKITDRMIDEVERSGLTEALESRTKGPVLSHHRFKAAIAGCPNCCSEPQIKDFALIARSHPRLTDEECLECGECVGVCRERAIAVAGRPDIDQERCVGCGACSKVCPTGAIAEAPAAYDVTVGGKLGRHARLAVTVLSSASDEEAIRALRVCLTFLIERGQRGERLAAMLEREGFSHLLSRIRALRE